MRFAVFFDLQLPRPWRRGDEQRLFREALEQIELADRIGIEHAWAQEHHFLEEYSHSSAPEVFLGAASQRTRRIRLGHGVSLMPPAYNHPARVVERIATLDLVSDGRVEWGTGESASRLELEGFGIDMVDKRAMWAEALTEAIKMMCEVPYPGHQGRYFSMPARNVVPKPVQEPHPPLWMACSNRDTLKLAARLGVGALTFAFVDHREARFWVEEYYDTFRRECTPIGRAVNPNVAMLSGSMCHPDGEVARARGVPGLQFFAFALSHYYRTGTHVPGQTDIWSRFQAADSPPLAGMGGIGDPGEVMETFARLEEAGVDQVILLQQSGPYPHEQICESLELLGREVLPAFQDRRDRREAAKRQELEVPIREAMERAAPPPPPVEVEPIAAYPVLWEQAAGQTAADSPARSLGASALWKLHVSGGRGGR